MNDLDDTYVHTHIMLHDVIVDRHPPGMTG